MTGVQTCALPICEASFADVAGSFAAAIWDRKVQTLLLVNDRLGLRPIYYTEHGGLFRFASEVKAILTDPNFPHCLDEAAVADLFNFSFVMGEKTLFEDIKLLPASSFLRYRDGHWAISRYWDLTYPDRYPRHPDKWYADLIYEALKNAVTRMVRPEVRYGLSLSGGLDSRWIAALLSEVQSESQAFTLGTDDSDDVPFAKMVAKQNGMVHHCWPSAPNFLAELGEAYAYIVDGMDDLLHMEEFPLTVQVGEYADVSVGGFLGDGLFGYEVNPISASLRKSDVVPYRLWRTRGGRPSDELMAQAFGEQKGRALSAQAVDSLSRCFAEAPCDRGFQAIQYFDLRQAERRFAYLAQLAKLPYVDVYHPIADHEVIDAALQLPPDQLMFERAYRRAMILHLPEMGAIPWTFTLTTPDISVPALLAKKVTQLTLGNWLRGTRWGQHPLIRARRYYVNYHRWSRGPLRAFFEQVLLSPETAALGLFDMDGLRTALSDHMEGRKVHIDFLGTALTVALWARLFYLPSTPLRPQSLEVAA